MTAPTDETLFDYLKGKLPDKERAMVESYVTANDEALARIRALGAELDLIRRAFDAPMREPPPRHLVDLVIGSGAAGGTGGAGTRHGSNVVAIGQRAEARRSAGRAGQRYALPMAAAVALAVGLTVGYGASRWGSDRIESGRLALGPLSSSAPLTSILESKPSGVAVSIPAPDRSARRLTVVATFYDRAKRPCREFELLGPQAEPTPLAVGLACREEDGRWLVEGVTRIADLDADGKTYRPSGATERDALEGLLTMLGAGTALAPADERELIGRGWK